ncbi:piggyBac transposable element-derived protein 3-like [Pempheris klunzingeri]|uniref:piggyBac transposable element-derived protein 3-like n=1 Tax=Pempheris klunzingeri TaxID=3127111 RepID=UPI0039818A21
MDASTFYRKRAGGLQTRVPPVESDDSCLSDSDNSDEDFRLTADDESSSDEDPHSSHDAPASMSATGPSRQSAATARRRRPKVVWETVQQCKSAKDTPIWQGALLGVDEAREPIQYFRDFFDADLLDVIVQQSNLYCTQNNPNNALKLDQNELEQFIGTLVYMSIVHVPRSRMYWSSECRVVQVADVMSRDRWGEIKKFIHFNDNSSMAANSDDKLFKIRPIVDSLLQKFQVLPQDQMLCVDEQMVPFKGRSSLKQYIPKKPHKWGYKIFVLCDTKGLVHSFDIFTGKIDPVPGEPDIGASGNIVLKLAQVIHGAINHLLYFDNWFSSLDLFAALANKGIPALGTVQQSRLQGCSFSTNAEMKKKGRGTLEEKQAVVDGAEMRAVKWFDNRGVIVASTFASAQPVSNVERWDRKLKKRVSVECPSMISLYNKFMGGVDALDALIAYYRIQIRSKKYYHRFFFHLVDMVIVNSWLLYRRDCDSLGVPRKQQKDLLAFRTSIAQALCMQGKDMSRKKRGRPSSDVEREFHRKKHRGPAKAIPTLEVRSDAGPAFESQLIRELCTVYRCRKIRTTPYRPQGNGAYQSWGVDGSWDTGGAGEWLHAHRQRLQEAIKVVKQQAGLRQEQDQRRCNRRVRGLPLLPGERVLVRNFRRRAKGKLGPYWDPHPQVVVCQPDPQGPVYKVRPEGGEGPIRILHRCHLRCCPPGCNPRPPEIVGERVGRAGQGVVPRSEGRVLGWPEPVLTQEDWEMQESGSSGPRTEGPAAPFTAPGREAQLAE